MNALETQIEQLLAYSAAPTISPEKLSDFWKKNLTKFNGIPVDVRFSKTADLFPSVDIYSAVFYGSDDTPLHAQLLIPRFAKDEQLPCAIVYHGYGDSKGFPEKHAALLLMGVAVFAVDVRGQGGETGNHLTSTYGMASGWITQGILDPENSYFQAIVLDAVRAVDAAASHPRVDGSRLFTAGLSQGGGLALMTAALCGEKLKFTSAAFPGMCHMDLGIMKSTGSLSEAAFFVRKHPEHLSKVLYTLSLFDVLNHARAIKVPVHIQVGLKDPVCIPETIIAVYNRIPSRKKLAVHPFTAHEMTEHLQRRMLEYVRDELFEEIK
ncbi:acetylxylan esterase [Metabacillus sp. KIGAM252]|uniref:Acetylxylan esterase n=1 Tax=Metabacillus flavus TaxID=2823519 RepID=A0ABS5LBV9_9BACI|nr:acetylxylan esterase [Metabacillus flavus]MBS2968214.1 acetylxylan esterase [Metabacillus flavus]